MTLPHNTFSLISSCQKQLEILDKLCKNIFKCFKEQARMQVICRKNNKEKNSGKVWMKKGVLWKVTFMVI